MGTNDIRRKQSASGLIAGYPRHNVPASGTHTGWNDAKTAIRNDVNRRIRKDADFDAVIAFDRMVRDPSDPDLIAGVYNCDGIHPNPCGYYIMGASVDLDVFEARGRRGRGDD